MSAIASSSRVVLPPLKTALQVRTVLHHARPPRMPVLQSPHNPKTPLPTSGTSHPNPGGPSSTGAVSKLEGTSLTFHYAPPPSAPSYTTGAIPPLLKWVRGEQLSTSGEERAPMRRTPAYLRDGAVEPAEWSQDVMETMRTMRLEGKSRKEIAKSLSIPDEQAHLIARVAPLSAEQAAERSTQLARQKASWPYKKRLTRETRTRRKTFW